MEDEEEEEKMTKQISRQREPTDEAKISLYLRYWLMDIWFVMENSSP